MDLCDFEKYKSGGAIHWTAISRNVNKHSLGFDARYRTCAALLKDIASPESAISLADIGCGDGMLFYYLRKVLPNAAMTGFDGSPEGIALARRLLEKHLVKNVELRCLDFAAMDSVQHTYNTVTALEVIEHAQDPVKFLINVRRLLTPGGHVVISTPIKLTERPKDKDHCKEFFPQELKGMVEAAGFDIIEHKQIMPVYYLIRYFKATRLGFGKSKVHKKIYNFLNIFFNHNVFLRRAPDAWRELYSVQFILARKRDI